MRIVTSCRTVTTSDEFQVRVVLVQESVFGCLKNVKKHVSAELGSLLLLVVVVRSKTYDAENEALMLGRMKLQSKVSSLCFGVVVCAFIFGNTSIVVTGQLFVSFAPMR